MTVRILFFASLRERTGQKSMDMEIEPGTRAEELLARLRRELPAMAAAGRISLAVNEEYCDPHLVLQEGDEVALIPPVSGGR